MLSVQKRQGSKLFGWYRTERAAVLQALEQDVLQRALPLLHARPVSEVGTEAVADTNK